MITVSSELLSWADFLSKVGQFLFGLCTLALAVWAAMIKRKDLFRSELTKKQLEELGKVRTDLQSILFDFYYIPSIAQMIQTMGWNIDVLKEKDFDSWEQYQRYKKTSLDLYYKFSDINYYLFPDWIDPIKRRQLVTAMQSFAPFTLNATQSKSQQEREAYAVVIAEMKTHFDIALRAHA
jgi:hypothetical protein